VGFSSATGIPDGHSSSVDSTLSTSGINTAFHIHSVLRLASTVNHLVVEEGHVRVLMGSGCSSASTSHGLRVKHEVLGLGHHLVTCQKAFTHVVSARTSHHNLLSASQIIHKLTARARAFIPWLLVTLRLTGLVAHASVSEAVASLLRANSLQLLAEGLSAVHSVIGPLAEHHIRRTLAGVLSLIEAITCTLSSSLG
jgi:hypothetical protein